MNDGWRWVVAVVAVAAIVALLVFARGAPDHGDTEATPPPAGVVTVI